VDKPSAHTGGGKTNGGSYEENKNDRAYRYSADLCNIVLGRDGEKTWRKKI
jgi:hypothetical protein